MKTAVLLILTIILFGSCDKEKDEILYEHCGDYTFEGYNEQADLSSENISITISTEVKLEWIHEIKLNGDHVDTRGIDLKIPNLVIDRPKFKIERKSISEFHIEMPENETGSEIVLTIGLWDGICRGGITITQSN